MNRYGQSITWSTPTAPHPFTGICTSYTYREQLQRQLDEDENGDNLALIQHSHKADVSFEARVTQASTDFLDLSAGAAVVVSGVSGGVVLATRAVERWTLQQPKTISLSGTHFPDITQASPVLAGVSRTAFTPDQSSFSTPIITPGGKLIYGTQGLSDTGGIVHMVELTQELQITEDDPDPTGKILGAATHGYLRTLAMDLLIRTSDTLPVSGTVLNLTSGGATPTFISNYQVESVEQKFAEKRGKMISVHGVSIPPLG